MHVYCVYLLCIYKYIHTYSIYFVYLITQIIYVVYKYI